MASQTIRSVVVLGAGGNVGKATIAALVNDGFVTTAITSLASTTTFPANVKHIRSDYTPASLLAAFRGQDAVVSAVSRDRLTDQKAYIDTAIEAGVKVFLPSEYGLDTSHPSVVEVVPSLALKLDVLDYLKATEGSISWVAVVTGAFFDWGLSHPGFGGFDLPARKATLYDGGEVAYEATTLEQVGRAVARSLKSIDLTRNQHVRVNSFTVTQKEVVEQLERATGDEFTVETASVEALWQSGADRLKQGDGLGILSMITAAFYGRGGHAQYSTREGLWNEKIGLPRERLEDVVEVVVAALKL